jgi:hypothetical protein
MAAGIHYSTQGQDRRTRQPVSQEQPSSDRWVATPTTSPPRCCVLCHIRHWSPTLPARLLPMVVTCSEICLYWLPFLPHSSLPNQCTWGPLPNKLLHWNPCLSWGTSTSTLFYRLRSSAPPTAYSPAELSKREALS